MTATPIVALDVATLDDALALVDRLGASCDFYKVGSELFTAAGPATLAALRTRGKRVFLDLKLHDIPTTVRAAARAAALHGASLLTVHTAGGEAMVRAAVEGAGPSCGVLGVTVLTSLDAGTLADAWGRDRVDVDAEVVRLAGLAERAGAHGVVCSGAEVGAIVAAHRGRLAALVPGIRFADGATHDQRRVVTPGAASAAGASYLVLGRAVTAADDPRRAMDRAWAEIRLGGAPARGAQAGSE